MYVEFFGHTGSGKSTLQKRLSDWLEGHGARVVTFGRGLPLDPIALLRTARRVAKLPFFLRMHKDYFAGGVQRKKHIRTHHWRSWPKWFAANSYMQLYCSRHADTWFLSGHGFMMALLDTYAWHRLHATPFELTDRFVDDYLELVEFSPRDRVVLLDVKPEAAKRRDKARGSRYPGFSEGEMTTLYRSIGYAITLIRARAGGTVNPIGNETLEDAFRDILALMNSAAEKSI